MPSGRLLDVSHLPPPEPLEQVLAAIAALSRGQYLHVRHHREPLLLYPLLEDAGFAWRARPGRDVPFEIFIWRRDDETAQAAVHRLFEGA